MTHHLLDSLSVVGPLRHLLSNKSAGRPRVLDVGSGGGLPGLIIAVANPDFDVTLVDAVQKKTAFLTQAAVELGLRNVVVRHARIESLRGQFDVVTARAFAALADLVALTQHLLAPGGSWLAMKGRIDDSELRALPQSVKVLAVLPLAVPGLDETRHLVHMVSA